MMTLVSEGKYDSGKEGKQTRVDVHVVAVTFDTDSSWLGFSCMPIVLLSNNSFIPACEGLLHMTIFAHDDISS